jgi:hypothetical protein
MNLRCICLDLPAVGSLMDKDMGLRKQIVGSHTTGSHVTDHINPDGESRDSYQMLVLICILTCLIS